MLLEKYQSMDYTKKQEKKEETLTEKNEEISGWKAHINTRRPTWNVSTITEVFLNQKRVNLCEHIVKMASGESFE